MATAHLTTYLNDHLAGANALLELLEHVKGWYPDTDVGRFAGVLHAEVNEDRQTLEAVMRLLNVQVSTARTTVGWLASKVSDLKLKIDDSTGGTFRLLEAMEAASVGIEGKRLMWVALGNLAKEDIRIAGTDFDLLDRRAADQRQRVETVRVQAAMRAFDPAKL